MKIHKHFIAGVLYVSALFSPFSANAQQAGQVLFEQQTWTEIQSALKAGNTTILVPIGGTEQSGPYLAVGKHNVRVMALSQQIAQKLGHTMVAPVVAYVPEGTTSPRSSHMRFPGTITVPPDVFEKTLVSIGESFQVQGFRNIVFLGDHGGYQKYMEKAATVLNHEWQGKNAKALYIKDYYTAITNQYAKWLTQQGHGNEVGMHADISDTSLLLAVDPSMVRESALRASGTPSAAEGMYGGDPRHASAELGRVGVAMQVNAAVKAIEEERVK